MNNIVGHKALTYVAVGRYNVLRPCDATAYFFIAWGLDLSSGYLLRRRTFCMGHRCGPFHSFHRLSVFSARRSSGWMLDLRFVVLLLAFYDVVLLASLCADWKLFIYYGEVVWKQNLGENFLFSFAGYGYLVHQSLSMLHIEANINSCVRTWKIWNGVEEERCKRRPMRHSTAKYHPAFSAIPSAGHLGW